MAKAVFRPGELVLIDERVIISAPTDFGAAHNEPVSHEEEVETAQPVEEYTGPTAEDLRHEAEAFKIEWDIERQAMIESAQAEANEIVQKADMAASKQKQEKIDEAEALLVHAREDAKKIVSDATQLAEKLETETRSTLDEEKTAALNQAREDGRNEGYAEGKTEVDRLIERTHTVLERAQDKRGEILVQTEEEVIRLVLLMVRKVVKVISESQHDVVVSNVIEALKKVKDRGNIIIRVNIEDVKLTTEHTKEFIKALEGVKSIQVAEDSSVDMGGCVIETDFGEIDARISSQLAELEAKILEISPIKTKPKSLTRSSVKADT
ncbi:MAG: flagellar assembly protein FliH [Treponema sp.]|jgi:flagellar assembly protein FliH|nr:flagellar assembly protein FliH [Treponema sp.]